jgi:flagellar basal-body rod protein FlgF
MMAQQQRLDVLANNLANVNTRGFKADSLTFSDMLVRSMADEAGNGGVIGVLASGPAVDKQTTDFSQGGVEVTGNNLDCSLGGAGMFAVQTSAGVRYTRDGAFTLNATGGLVTRNGDAVLDTDGKPITGINGRVAIEKDGSIHLSDKKETIATLGRFNGTFTKDANGKNLFEAANAVAFGAKEGPSVDAGQLETANIEPVSLMVQMIALQRAYEISQKMVQSQDDSTAKLNEVMA